MLACAVKLTLPNPFEPQDQSEPGADCAVPHRQSQHRAAMCAAARRVIAEKRFVDFTVKRVADVCGFSTQTVFSHFKSKDGILAAAINDYSLALLNHGRLSGLGRNTILSFVDALGASCQEYPEFFSSILPNTYFSRMGSLVYVKTERYGTNMFNRELDRLRRRDGIVEGTDVLFAAEAITAIVGSTLLEWARGSISAAQLRQRLLAKTNLIFVGLERQRPTL